MIKTKVKFKDHRSLLIHNRNSRITGHSLVNSYTSFIISVKRFVNLKQRLHDSALTDAITMEGRCSRVTHVYPCLSPVSLAGGALLGWPNDVEDLTNITILALQEVLEPTTFVVESHRHHLLKGFGNRWVCRRVEGHVRLWGRWSSLRCGRGSRSGLCAGRRLGRSLGRSLRRGLALSGWLLVDVQDGPGLVVSSFRWTVGLCIHSYW